MPVIYATGEYVSSVAAADLNGDGKPDLAVTNQVDHAVSVLLNQGDGTFAAPVGHHVGPYPNSVAAADLNGDGKPDLAVGTVDGVWVLLSHGDGTFADAASYGTEAVYAVAVADLNGDGRPDLAVAHYASDSVGVLLNKGSGTFAAAVEYDAAGDGPRSVVTADLNGDGAPDLVVQSTYGTPDWATLSVLMNQGDGSFAAAIHYDIGSGKHADCVTAADLNGDGKPDLAACTGNGVGVLLNQGNGTFADPVYSAPTGFRAVVDVDGDGKPDLIGTSDDFVSVLFNQGNGVFDAAVGDVHVWYPWSIAAADLNGDGRPDLAVANYYQNSVSVLLHSCMP